MEEVEVLVNQIKKDLMEDNHQGALSGSEQLVELQPESAEAWFLKGKALFHLNEFSGARDALQSAVDHGYEGEDQKSLDDMLADCKRNQILKAVKRDWYQTDTHVNVNILVKKVNPDDVTIDYGEDWLKFGVKIPQTDVVYQLNLNLADKIIKEQCAFKVLQSKVEIKLKKADSSRWPVLEAEENKVDPKVKNFKVDSNQSALTYPSSAKASKDWDKLAQEVKQEEKDEKLEGDAALNKLFQDIYSNASDETKKAMNKSFQESNGTVLSTNWSEIGDKHTDMQCPDGMEFKNY